MDPGARRLSLRRAWTVTWTTGWTVVVALGLGAALLSRDLGEVLAALTMGALMGAVAGTAVAGLRDERAWPRPVLLGVVWGAAGLTAWVTVARAYPLLALVLLVSALLSCPWLLQWVRGARVGSTPERPSAPSWHRQLLDRPEVVVPGLETATLCELWRESGTWVARVSAPSTLLSVVRLRDALIEEFLRRSPDEADAWLRSESLDSSDPARFLGS